MMQLAFQADDDLGARVERARRSIRFKKVPSTSRVLRLLVEDALSRWEGQENADASPKGDHQ